MIINDRDGYNKVQETFVMHKKGDVIIMRAEQNFKWEKLSLGYLLLSGTLGQKPLER